MYAGACVRDQYNRPIAGTVTFCPNGLDKLSTDWSSSVATIVHELMHALGFTKDSFDKFVDSKGNVRPQSKVRQSFLERGHTVYKIVSPNVLSEVRKHFSCQSLNGAELEDDLGAGTALSHWEKRIFGREIMVGVTNGYAEVVSRVTLAFFEDSGWYVPDYSKAGELDYGKGEDCAFATGYCLKQTTGDPINNYEDSFCAENGKVGCTQDLGAVASCSILQYSSSLPSYDRYFSNSRWGGTQVADFCPMWSPSSWNGDNFKRICSDSAGFPGSNFHSQGVILGETYDDHARCIESQVIKNGYVAPTEFKGSCLGISCTKSQIRIKIGGSIVATCSTTEEGVTKTIKSTGYSGNVKCPNFSMVCGDQDCGIHGRTSGSICVCDPGYYQPSKGSICKPKTSIGGQSMTKTEEQGELKPEVDESSGPMSSWYAEKLPEGAQDVKPKKEDVSETKGTFWYAEKAAKEKLKSFNRLITDVHTDE